MSLPPDGALWRPVNQLDQLDVRLIERDGHLRVEIIDKRTWLELISLPPGAAAALATVLAEQSRRAGWPTGHEPGS